MVLHSSGVVDIDCLVGGNNPATRGNMPEETKKSPQPSDLRTDNDTTEYGAPLFAFKTWLSVGLR